MQMGTNMNALTLTFPALFPSQTPISMLTACLPGRAAVILSSATAFTLWPVRAVHVDSWLTAGFLLNFIVCCGTLNFIVCCGTTAPPAWSVLSLLHVFPYGVAELQVFDYA